MKVTDNCIGENSTHFIDLFNYRISILIILIRVRSSSYKYILIGEGEWYQGHDYNAFQDLRKSREEASKREIYTTLIRIDLFNREQYEFAWKK